MIDSKHYSEDYYRTSNYADYMERADRYKRTASEIAELLRKLNLAGKNTSILDYGCAVGFLVEGLREVGYSQAKGFEISSWAAAQGRKRGLEIIEDLEVFNEPGTTTDVMLSLDVFEHMSNQQINTAVNAIKPNVIVARIPTAEKEGDTFHLEISRKDPTHINCKTTNQWIDLFRSLGYQTFLKLNLYTIYHSPGVACLLMIK